MVGFFLKGKFLWSLDQKRFAKEKKCLMQLMFSEGVQTTKEKQKSHSWHDGFESPQPT